ncbi:M10 family metallopeptidase C-terminal domain-containing protein [Dolichospermum sp. ST_sed9]|nr:M10 family metallopeptidase C-terminal domain-containing protein [Dolichospermum sp. ST_sed9]
MGSDTITDGSGVDTVSFAGSTASIVFDLGLTTIQTVGAGTQITLTAADAIENAIGGNGADSLFGNALNNRLDGGAGNDTLAGGLGNDTLVSGTGNDQFVFNGISAFGAVANGVDTITDFATTDKLVLSKTVFTALTSVVGAGFSVASNFAAVAVANNDLAGSNNALIVYNKTTGSLLYNQNGSAAGFGTGGEVANIFSSGTTTPVLAASNFIVIV